MSDAANKIEERIDMYRIAGANLLCWLHEDDIESMPTRLSEVEDWGNDIVCRAYFRALKEAQDLVSDYQELKNCPFCNGEAEIYIPPITLGDDDADVDWMQPYCTSCNATKPRVRFSNHDRKSDDFKKAFRLAIDSWNKRN